MPADPTDPTIYLSEGLYAHLMPEQKQARYQRQQAGSGTVSRQVTHTQTQQALPPPAGGASVGPPTTIDVNQADAQ